MSKKPKSRLNKRINVVRKHIIIKKNLLNKLKKIRKSIKNKKLQNHKQNTTVIRNQLLRKLIKKKKNSNKRLSNAVNSISLPYISKVRKINNQHNSKKYYQSRNNYQNKVMDKLNKINTKRRNTLKNNKNNHICLYKNFHEENIEVPYSYPGDLWVHNNLLVERDKPLELFDEDYLKEVYNNHRRICYGN